jgi:hypothetical protein
MRSFVPVLAAICAALSGCAGMHEPLIHRGPPIARSHTIVGDWRLDMRRDRFTGEIACRLLARNHKAFFAAGAVAFRFPDTWNTGRAIYRVDSGELRRWREDLPELTRIGAPIERGGVDNPSKGLVWIPLRRLEEASSIAIEARPDRAPVTFHFRGLHGLYQAAVERGCSPDSRFVG